MAPTNKPQPRCTQVKQLPCIPLPDPSSSSLVLHLFPTTTMTRKRKRSAYTALSSARVLRYQPHHTSRTQTSTTLHITPTPPESITDFDSSQPSPQTPTSTPLILRASDIASVQAALGFTPDTPANSLVYLGPDEQQHAKALISSPQHLPAHTPHAPRRLSLGSTVTPIPLHLESESPEKENSMQPPLLPPQQPLPSPMTPYQKIQPPSPPPSPDTHPRIPIEHQTDGLLDPPPLPIEKNGINPTPTLNATPLFMTGTGKPLAPTNNALATPHQSKSFPTPIFTTGKGNPLGLVNAKSVSKAAKLLNPTSSNAPLPPSNLVKSLFSTGKGKPLDITKSIIPPSAALRTPLTDKTNVSSLFTTGGGKRVPVPSNPGRSLSLLRRPPSSPHTPTMPEDNLRKTLFSDPAPPPSNAKRPSPSDMTLRNLAGKPNRRTHQSRPLKTTPFRQPRRVVSRKEAARSARLPAGNLSIPRWEVPRLSKGGSIFCDPQLHEHHRSSSKRGGHLVPDFLFAPNCLQSCLSFVYEKVAFGEYECLPRDVVQHFQLKDLASFSVGNVLSWTRALFPTVIERPATCFGSAAWTRMSYSLATWKLARLENDRPARNKSSVDSFLSAANLLREILRRIEVEWHASCQPHLLRMMRKDSSPASHVVLMLSGFELGIEGRIVVFLSDGWYLVRALVDDTVQKRIWSGNLRVGDKVSVVGASLDENEGSRLFFFGDGDEIGASVLRLFANGVKKAPSSTTRLGIHPCPWSGSLRWIKDDGGKCPMLKVVILRSYPVFYMEALTPVDTKEKGIRKFTSRRAEGEDQARAVHQEKFREKLRAELDHPNENMDDTVEPQLPEYRDVRTVKEVLICGIKDDPAELSARKLLRVYNVSETLQGLMSKEGEVLLLSQMLPKKSGWTCKPDGVRHAPQREAVQTLASRALLKFPRKAYSASELRSGAVRLGRDFDGVFLVLYVSPECSNRFAYLTSAPTESINVLALQLSDSDSECLPTALQINQNPRPPRFPIIGIRDAKFCYCDSKLDILHANSTMRTSFLTSRSLARIRRSSPLRLAYDDLASRVRGKEPQLEVLRDAVTSFASGNRSSVSAYFTSTQDM